MKLPERLGVVLCLPCICVKHLPSFRHDGCGVGVVIATESALSFSVLVYSCYAIVVASVNVFLWVVIIPTGFWYALCVFTVDAASGLQCPHNIIPVHTKANNGSGRGADGAPPYTIIFYISFSTRSDTGTGLRVYDYFQYMTTFCDGAISHSNMYEWSRRATHAGCEYYPRAKCSYAVSWSVFKSLLRGSTT